MTVAALTAPAPGWYPDPHDPRDLRWWDGAGWTANTAPLPEPEPAAEPDPERASIGEPEPGASAEPIVFSWTTDVLEVEPEEEVEELDDHDRAADLDPDFGWQLTVASWPEPARPAEVEAEPEPAPEPELAVEPFQPQPFTFRARPAQPEPEPGEPEPGVALPAYTSPLAVISSPVPSLAVEPVAPASEPAVAELAVAEPAVAEPAVAAPTAAEPTVAAEPEPEPEAPEPVAEVVAPHRSRRSPRRAVAGTAAVVAVAAGAAGVTNLLSGDDTPAKTRPSRVAGADATMAAPADTTCLKEWNTTTSADAAQLRVTLGQFEGALARVSRVKPLPGTLMAPDSCGLTVYEPSTATHAIFVSGVKDELGYLDVTSYPRASQYGWPKSAREANVAIMADGSVRAH